MHEIDYKFAMMIAPRLERWRVISHQPFKVNFRCPVCGDSKKSKTKARGYLKESKSGRSVHYGCFNCGASMNYGQFLNVIDPTLFREYKTERAVDARRNNVKHHSTVDRIVVPKRLYEKSEVLKGLTRVSKLPLDHPAQVYVRSRKIPSNMHYRLYHCDKFVAWRDQFRDEESSMAEHPRLVIPFIDGRESVIAATGRSYDQDSDLRYVTFKIDPQFDRPIFGLDVVDMSKKFYIVEGPLDSLFLPNAIAVSGGDLTVFNDIEKMRNWYNRPLSSDAVHKNAVMIFDNERRAAHTISRMQKAIKNKFSIVVWPKHVEHKDINELVLHSHTTDDIVRMIDTHTFRGLQAELRLQQWRLQ